MPVQPYNLRDEAYIFLLVAGCFELKGDYEAAIESFEESIKRNPDEHLAYVHLAGLYEKTGDKEMADKYIEKGRKLREKKL